MKPLRRGFAVVVGRAVLFSALHFAATACAALLDVVLNFDPEAAGPPAHPFLSFAYRVLTFPLGEFRSYFRPPLLLYYPLLNSLLVGCALAAIVAWGRRRRVAARKMLHGSPEVPHAPGSAGDFSALRLPLGARADRGSR